MVKEKGISNDLISGWPGNEEKGETMEKVYNVILCTKRIWVGEDAAKRREKKI